VKALFNSVLTDFHRCLQERFSGFHVGSTKEIGIDPDAKEVRQLMHLSFYMTNIINVHPLQAICFALLAHQTCRGRPTNVPSESNHFSLVPLSQTNPASLWLGLSDRWLLTDHLHVSCAGVTGARKQVILGKICPVLKSTQL